jgi:SAM-dependent methyltransferase
MLGRRFPDARIAAVDLSAALLTAARLPLADRACDLIVAAFCLYHSPEPASVIAEIARCLTRDGTAVIAVKSADSYRELDRLVAASGLDPAAESRPSLLPGRPQRQHHGPRRNRAGRPAGGPRDPPLPFPGAC